MNDILDQLNDAQRAAVTAAEGPVLVVAAGAGLYLLLRRPQTRLVGAVLGLLVGVTVLLRAIMGFDPFNPDYYGYMLPAVAGLTVCAAVFACVIATVLLRAFAGARILVPILVVALLILPIFRARAAREQIDLSEFRTTRLLLDLSLDQ